MGPVKAKERKDRRARARATGRALPKTLPGDGRHPVTGRKRLAGTKTPPPRTYIGMDVHKDTITLAILGDHELTPRIEKITADETTLHTCLDRIAVHGAEVRCCYEASYAGYVVWHWVTHFGYHCDVVAPSMIPKKPGDRRKTDARDAANLARLYRAGDLAIVHVPTTADERVRDVMRCRTVFQRQLLRARHFITNFTARRGLVYRQTTTRWKAPHLAWLKALLTSDTLEAESALVFAEYYALLQYCLDRRQRLDEEIELLATADAYAPRVARLRCFRGIDTHAAMVLITELHDWRRFETAQQLTAYLGLVPREYSSGATERRGRITKAGNAHCRHILIQAAWHYRCIPTRFHALQVRQRGQPADVMVTSWKAQQRLYRRYHKLALTRGPQRAVVAIARALAGFLWSVMRDTDVRPIPLDVPLALVGDIAVGYRQDG
jgi:transposase